MLLRKLTNASGYPTSSEQSVCHVYQRIPTNAERAPTHGKYQGADAAHHFPASCLSGTLLFPGDQVVVSGQRTYDVQKVEYHRLIDSYVTYGVSLSVYSQLQDTISVQRPTPTIDALGDQIPSWTTVCSGAAAAVRLIGQSEKDLNSPVGTRRSYEVTVDRQVYVGDGDRIVWLNNASGILHYKRLINPGRTDELPVLACEETQ